MHDRADAHIHLFEGSFKELFTARPGVQIDEAALYQSLMKDHGVSAALVVGFAMHEWCADNTAFLARMVREHRWVHPTAYFKFNQPFTLADVERLGSLGFVGLSFYVFGDDAVRELHAVPDEIWSWLVEHRCVVSVNSKGKDWAAWRPILEKHRNLRVLISHLGLPPRVTEPPADPAAAFPDVLALAKYPQTRVKLSGFYALSDPGHDYPHMAAWPYVRALHESFGPRRLLWASDFSPCLDCLTYPQTYGLFSRMPFFDDAERQALMGGNLLALLNEVDHACAG